jgi:glycosyltransferase involved in cell wall biosynthesis
MLALENVPRIEYTDPWVLPFPERFGQLTRKGRRIAYFYERADNSTFRYRIYNPVQVLNTFSDDVSASFFFLGDAEHFARIADAADLLVICRTRYSLRANAIVTHFRSRGKKVIYDIDDLVFDTDYAHLVAATIEFDTREDGEGWDEWFAYVSRIGAVARLCDGCITTNACLAERLARFTGKPVKVLPNFINREQLRMSDLVFEEKARAGFKGDGRFHIGYFSGSPTHRKDFAIVSGAIEALMKRHDHVWLTVAGYMSAAHLEPALRHRVEHLPFTDYVNLQHAIGAVELNVVPLQSNRFTDCKSELKYFEAGIVGTPTVATPTFTYSRCIAHRENGYLAKAHEWEDVLESAIADSATYRAVVQAGRKHARASYAWDRLHDDVLASVDWS